MPHISSIDGLRAVAVFGVILNHYGQGFSGGFLGVDVFFVISGFVITRLISSELNEGRFSFWKFYERRAKRILPALLIVVFATLVIGYFTLTPAEFVRLAESALAASFGVSNIYFFNHVDYFALPARYFPLLHTWSLGVEEQFYLVWPIVLFGLMRFLRPYIAPITCLAVIVGLVLSISVGAYNGSAAFYMPFTRAWELGVGCALVFIPSASRRMAPIAAYFGSFAVVASFLFLHEGRFPPGMISVPACVGAAAILWSREDLISLPQRVLSSPGFGFFGQISYSLYLWHWPILVFFVNRTLKAEPTMFEALALAVVATILATVSWLTVESPARGSAKKIALVAVLSFGILVVVPFAGAVIWGRGLPSRMSSASNLLAAGADDYSKNRVRCHRSDEVQIPLDQSCRYGAPVSPDVVVWGDSHGVELGEAIGTRLGEIGHSLLSITYSSCPPALGFDSKLQRNCPAHNDAVIRFLTARHDLKTVVLLAYHEMHLAHNREAYLSGLGRTVEALIDAGKKVVFIAPHPVPKYSVPQTAAKLAAAGGDLSILSVDRALYEKERAPIMEFFMNLEKRGDLVVVDPIESYCRSDKCPMVLDGHVVLFDTDHLSSFAAKKVANQIDPRVFLWRPDARGAANQESAQPRK